MISPLKFVVLAVALSNVCLIAYSQPSGCDVFISASHGSDRSGTPGTYISPFASIQHALSASGASTSFCIEAAVYEEIVTITRSIKFTGFPDRSDSGLFRPTLAGDISVIVNDSETTVEFHKIRFGIHSDERLAISLVGALASVSFVDCQIINEDQAANVKGAFVVSLHDGSAGSITFSNVTAYRMVEVHLALENLDFSSSSFVSFESSTIPMVNANISNFGALNFEGSNIDTLSVRAIPNFDEQTGYDQATVVSFLSSTSKNSVEVQAAKLDIQRSVLYRLAIFGQQQLLRSSVGDISDWFWKLTENILHDKLRIVGFMNKLNLGQIVLRRNNFIKGSNSDTQIYFAGSDRLDVTVDAKSNWFGDASGPSSCCSDGGHGIQAPMGFDFSQFCLDEECTQTSEFVTPAVCALEFKCNNSNLPIFIITGIWEGVLLVIFIVLFLRCMQITETLKRQTWIATFAAFVLLVRGSASSVGGLFVSCWTLAGRMPVAGPSAAQVPLIPFASCMVLIFALHFLSAATSFWPTRFHLLLSLTTLLFAVFLPTLGTVIQVTGFAPTKLEIGWSAEFVTIYPSVTVLILVMLISLFPGAIQAISAWYAWKLLVQHTMPELAKIERTIELTESLLSTGSGLKSSPELQSRGRSLVWLFIPSVLGGSAILSMSLAYLAHLRPLDATSFMDVIAAGLALFFSGQRVFVSIVAAIVIYRRFFDTIVLWAATIFTLFAALMGIVSVGFNIATMANLRDALGGAPGVSGVAISATIIEIIMCLYSVRGGASLKLFECALTLGTVLLGGQGDPSKKDA